MISQENYEKLKIVATISNKASEFCYRVQNDFEEPISSIIIEEVDKVLQEKFGQSPQRLSQRILMKFIKEIINSPEFKEFITTGVKKVKGGIKNFFKNLWNKIFKKKK